MPPSNPARFSEAHKQNHSIVYSQARVRKMPGDGSCWYHSAASYLPDTTPEQLRVEIAAFVARNPEYLINDVPLSDWVWWDATMTVLEYAKCMYQDHAWGGGLENACLAQLYERDVDVYLETQGRFHRIARFESPHPSTEPPIAVLYRGGEHYDALQLL